MSTEEDYFTSLISAVEEMQDDQQVQKEIKSDLSRSSFSVALLEHNQKDKSTKGSKREKRKRKCQLPEELTKDKKGVFEICGLRVFLNSFIETRSILSTLNKNSSLVIMSELPNFIQPNLFGNKKRKKQKPFFFVCVLIAKHLRKSRNKSKKNNKTNKITLTGGLINKEIKKENEREIKKEKEREKGNGKDQQNLNKNKLEIKKENTQSKAFSSFNSQKTQNTDQKALYYSLTLSDLNQTTIVLHAKYQAKEIVENAKIGQVLLITNPRIINSRNQKSIFLQVGKIQQIMILGKAQDFSFCNYKNPETKENCKFGVDRSRGRYCKMHLEKILHEQRMSRMSLISRNATRKNIRKRNQIQNLSGSIKPGDWKKRPSKKKKISLINKVLLTETGKKSLGAKKVKSALQNTEKNPTNSSKMPKKKRRTVTKGHYKTMAYLNSAKKIPKLGRGMKNEQIEL
ncbi:protein mcm10 [Anaeramoeba flamelloides]|uniref:Protein mcm10 n=1 Tax=Anaeramoeba flamelloides TaxID=1746091 RepID=A0AAV7Z0A5_9EUKA|nr:protein mcm10 [Anaeramoeba flamelloides]